MRLWTILIAMLLAAMPVAAQEPQEEDPQAETIDDGTQDPSADPADEVEEAAPTNKPDFAEVVANTRAVWTEPEGSTAGEDEIAAVAQELNDMAARLERYRSSSLGELIQAQQTAQAAIEGLPDPVLILDEKGRLTTANAAATKLLAVNAEATDDDTPEEG